jgi:integrase
MRGCITRRGKRSWQLKFDLPAEGGKRRTRYVTVRGTRRDAERERVRLLHELDTGQLIDPNKQTIAEYLLLWLDGLPATRAASTVQRYADYVHRHIIPTLGRHELQKLKPVHVKSWLDEAAKQVTVRGTPISSTTLNHMRMVLRTALQDAVRLELLHRNVVDAVRPRPKSVKEVEILDAAQISTVLAALMENQLYPIVALALASGMRRGELLALRWSDIGATSVKVERSLEHTRAGGLRFKPPKNGKPRTVAIGPKTIAMLAQHRAKQLELRMALGMGKPNADALVFCDHEGRAIPPNRISIYWPRAIKGTGVDVDFHALRHTHASALIAAGEDVVKVSKRLGHSSPAITLRIYAHLFDKNESASVAAIESLL